jgi:hypothetical protein
MCCHGKRRVGDGKTPCRAAAGRRGAIAHIGFLFSGLVDDGQLSFLAVRPIR